jgi:hypothetical protein
MTLSAVAAAPGSVPVEFDGDHRAEGAEAVTILSGRRYRRSVCEMDRWRLCTEGGARIVGRLSARDCQQ